MSNAVVFTGHSFAQEVPNRRCRSGRLLGRVCGPCKQIAPTLIRSPRNTRYVESREAGRDQNSEVSARFGIQGIPTLMGQWCPGSVESWRRYPKTR